MTQTPVISLFRKWEAAQVPANEKGLSEAEVATRVEVMDRLEREIIATPGTCPADFAAKVIACTYEGCNGLPDKNAAPQLWAEARALLDGMRADLGDKVDYLALDAARISHVLNAALDLKDGPQLSGMIGLCADLVERLANEIDALPRR